EQPPGWGLGWVLALGWGWELEWDWDWESVWGSDWGWAKRWGWELVRDAGQSSTCRSTRLSRRSPSPAQRPTQAHKCNLRRIDPGVSIQHTSIICLTQNSAPVLAAEFDGFTLSVCPFLSGNSHGDLSGRQ